MKKDLATLGNSSSDSNESEHLEDECMLVFKDDEDVFDSLFALIVKLEDEDTKEKVTLLKCLKYPKSMK